MAVKRSESPLEKIHQRELEFLGSAGVDLDGAIRGSRLMDATECPFMITERPYGMGTNAGVQIPATGPVKVIRSVGTDIAHRGDIAEKVKPGDIVVFTVEALERFGDRFLPYLVALEKGATGIIDQRGSAIDHGPAAAKEWGIPVVVGVGPSFPNLEGRQVTIYKGFVLPPTIKHADLGYRPFDFEKAELDRTLARRPADGTRFMLNLAFPEVITHAPELAAMSDGVGFLRTEFIWIALCKGVHPMRVLEEKGAEFLINGLKDRFRRILDFFGGRNEDAKMIWFRTQDMGADLLRSLEHGDKYERYWETNPGMGVRGSRRRGEMGLWGVEAIALRELSGEGYRNIGLFPPMIASAEDFRWWDELYFRRAGLRGLVKEGIMIEIAGAAVDFHRIVKVIDTEMTDEIKKREPEGVAKFRAENGKNYDELRKIFRLDWVILGTNDYSQSLMLADRTIPELQPMTNILKPPLFDSLAMLIHQATVLGIPTAIGGQAGSNPEVIKAFRPFGLTAASVNPDRRTLAEMVQAMVPWDTEFYPGLRRTITNGGLE